jgi:hypothetical protein
MSANLNTKIVTTTPYSIVNSDDVILVNVTSGPASIVLPANGLATGEDCCGDEDSDYNGKKKPVLKRSYYIKDYSGTSRTNPITITASGGKTINGVPFAMLNGAYSHVQVIYDGTNWMTIG